MAKTELQDDSAAGHRRTALRSTRALAFTLMAVALTACAAEPPRPDQPAVTGTTAKQPSPARVAPEKAKPSREALKIDPQQELGPLSLADANRLYAGYFNAGHYDKSLPYALHALHLSERQNGSRNATTAGLLANVGGVYQRLDRYAEAESLLAHAVTILQSELGGTHPVTINALNSLAAALIEQGDLERGEAYLKQIVAAPPAGSKEVQATRAAAFNNLAAIHERRQDLAGALVLYDEALALTRELFGPGHQVSTEIMARIENLKARAAASEQIPVAELPELPVPAATATPPSLASEQAPGSEHPVAASPEPPDTTVEPVPPRQQPLSPQAIALAAYRSGNFEEALQLWKNQARNGDPRALFHLGGMAIDGTGTPRDLIQAYYWLSQSAQQGYAPALALREQILPSMTSLQQDIARDMVAAGTTSPWQAGPDDGTAAAPPAATQPPRQPNSGQGSFNP